MKRVLSFEFNNSSYSSLSQQNKKVSLPSNTETNHAPLPSHGWMRRSTAKKYDRTTLLPMAITRDDIPNYFGSTMQSMCLAFFTLAYIELIDGAVFSGYPITVHAFLKFLTIVCIGLSLVAAFASIRVFILNSHISDESNIKTLHTDSTNSYSIIARFGSIIVAVACGIIICVFAVISLYVLLIGRRSSSQ